MYGKRIRTLREKLGLSQTQFIEAFVSKFGEDYRMAQTALSKYEQEQREPKFEMLIAFANFFEVTTDFLLGVSTDTKTDKKDTSLINEVSMILCNFTEEELLDIKKYSNFLRWSRGH